jgi:hypothetical protein
LTIAEARRQLRPSGTAANNDDPVAVLLRRRLKARGRSLARRVEARAASTLR